MSPASSPESPTAYEPCWFSDATISRLTLPTSAMRGDVDRLGVGDPQAVEELRLLAEPAHEVADLRATAVHDDRVHPDEAHEHDVLREQVGERGVVHRVPAVLDDDGPAR